MNLLDRSASLLSFLVALAASLGCEMQYSHTSFEGSWLFDQDAKATRDDEVPLEIAKGEALRLEGGFGRIEVTASPKGPYGATAKLSMPGATREEAERDLAKFKLKAEKSERVIRVWIDGEPIERALGGGTMRIRPDVQCTVTVPPGVALTAVSQTGDVVAQGPFSTADAKSAFGRVTVRDADGRVRAESSSGDVRVESVRRGGKTEAKSSFGKVTVIGVEADEVTARSESGDVTLNDVRARDIHAGSSFGKVELAKITGNVKATTNSGSVKLDAAERGKHELRSGFGTVSVRKSSGELEAVTKSGDVEVDGFDGTLRCESSFGGISVGGVLSGLDAKTSSGRVSVRARAGSKTAAPWNIRSGFGDVELDLPAEFSGVLDASSKFGSVETDSGGRVERGAASGSRVRQGLGSGGERVTVETSSGTVRVRQAK